MTELQVTFHGVRGSTPCHGDDVARHGGNTSCVSVQVPGGPPILLDLGTGLRYFAKGCHGTRPFVGTALLTHLHYDHILGLPFFEPLLRPGTALEVFGPQQASGATLREAVRDLVRPPQFPITLDEFAGDVRFHDVATSDWAIGPVQVSSRPIPHPGSTVGYRVTWGGASIAYIPDHQQPFDFDLGASTGSVTTEAVMELARDVDLLIHDAQFTPHDYDRKATWGHCTYQYAVAIAASAGAKRLALFHHDPAHDDDQVDAMERDAMALGDERGVEVFAACERMTVSLPAPEVA